MAQEVSDNNESGNSLKFYVIEATDTLIPFSYIFPSIDKDSVGSNMSIEDKRYPLYNSGVLEPGLTRVWYEILLKLTSSKSDFQINKHDLIIDVGGNFGYFSLLGASCSNDQRKYKVLTFEPVLNFSSSILFMFCLKIYVIHLLYNSVFSFGTQYFIK